MPDDLFGELFNLITFSSDIDSSDFNIRYSMDPGILDCQLKLYILLLVDKYEFDKRLKEFSESYCKLSSDKKEYINGEFYKVIEELQKNKIIKEKEKKYGKNNRYRFRYN